MKILSIIEMQQIDRQYNGLLRPSKRNHSSASSTIKTGKDSNTIVKYNHSPNQHEEGFNFFIRYAKRVAPDNPVFPNVSSITKIKDNYGNHINKYEMEVLIQGSKLSKEDIAIVIKQYFTESFYSDLPAVMQTVVYGINQCLRGNGSTNKIVKDDYLKRAILVLRQMYDKAETYCSKNDLVAIKDLHLDNIMFRRAEYGYQLVINDPLFIKQK